MDKDLLRSLTEPKEEHKHTKGEWCVSSGNQIVSMPSQCKITNNVSGWNYDESKANAKLISIAPELLQIAEMYLDSMKGTDAENSLAYQVTEKTLKKLL